MEKKNYWDIVCRNIVKIIFALEILYLYLLSIFSTNVHYNSFDGNGYAYNLDDQSWKHFIVLFLFIVIICGCALIYEKYKKRKPDIAIYKYIPELLVVGYSILVLLFIFIYGFEPKSDSLKIYRIAGQILEQDFTAFETTEYLYRYPDQIGIILYDMILITIFGKLAYIFFQIINVVLHGIALIVLGKMGNVIWENKVSRIQIILGYILFLPIFFYITYNYGTIPGLSFSIYAIYFSILALKYRKKRHYILAAVFIGIAILFKTNSIIFAIAIILVLGYDAVNQLIKRNRQTIISFIGILFILIAWFGSISVSESIMQGITGIPVSKGMPKTAWIAMGLSNDDDKPGSYNGESVEIFEANDYDYERANIQAINNIEKKLINYIKNPREAADFFSKKIAFQWNNPTFQCGEIIMWRTSWNKNSEASNFINQFWSGKLRYNLVEYMNYGQSLFLFGILIFLILHWKRLSIVELLPAIGFTGGFLFHTFWESSPQYTIPYYYLVACYSICGYTSFLKYVVNKIKEEKRKLITQAILTIGICGILIIGLAQTGIYSSFINVRSSEDRCLEYEEIKQINLSKY